MHQPTNAGSVYLATILSRIIVIDFLKIVSPWILNKSVLTVFVDIHYKTEFAILLYLFVSLTYLIESVTSALTVTSWLLMAHVLHFPKAAHKYSKITTKDVSRALLVISYKGVFVTENLLIASFTIKIQDNVVNAPQIIH